MKERVVDLQRFQNISIAYSDFTKFYTFESKQKKLQIKKKKTEHPADVFDIAFDKL